MKDVAGGNELHSTIMQSAGDGYFCFVLGCAALALSSTLRSRNFLSNGRSRFQSFHCLPPTATIPAMRLMNIRAVAPRTPDFLSGACAPSTRSPTLYRRSHATSKAKHSIHPLARAGSFPIPAPAAPLRKGLARRAGSHQEVKVVTGRSLWGG